MEKPQSGYYRQLLTMYPDVRIAFTHTPIIGCTKVDSSPILEVLKKSEDKFAPYYIKGIEDGSMVTIVENSRVEKVWENNGELYFKS